MKESFILLLWWVLFGGSHMLMSAPGWRSKLVARLGEWGFFGVYSLIALITIVPLCMYYGAHKHTGPQLWVTLLPYLIARDVNVLLMGLAFVLFVSGLAALTPSSILATTAPQAYGITRITRHPVFASFFLFGVAHCLVNGALSDIVFFGGFVVLSWLGAWRQDQRKTDELPGYTEFRLSTSFLPFGAIVSQRQPFPRGELRWGAIILGVVVFYLVRTFHPDIFGGILMTL